MWPTQLYQPVILLPRKPKVETCDLLTSFLQLALELSQLEGIREVLNFSPCHMRRWFFRQYNWLAYKVTVKRTQGLFSHYHAASYVTMAQKCLISFFKFRIRGISAKHTRMLEAGINIFSPCSKICVGSKIKTRRLWGKGYQSCGFRWMILMVCVIQE